MIFQSTKYYINFGYGTLLELLEAYSYAEFFNCLIEILKFEFK